MSDGTPRTRREIRSLSLRRRARVLAQYATAIDRMRELDLPDGDGRHEPAELRYQAALHGISPFRDDELWSKCRHDSWFFFPWHGMCLMRFERIVQHHLGNDTWSLPYWTAPIPTTMRPTPCRSRSATRAAESALPRSQPGINEGEPIDLFLWMRGRRSAYPIRAAGRGSEADLRRRRRPGRQAERERPWLTRDDAPRHRPRRGGWGDGLLRHGRPRPDLLAPSLQHRPALAGMARPWCRAR